MIEISFDGTALERALMKAVGTEARNVAMAKAATRVAAAARAQIVRELPTIFDRPTPFTLHSACATQRRRRWIAPPVSISARMRTVASARGNILARRSSAAGAT